jgi:exopolysaccharide biosynthesis polyprenyl glycosylphosphotransferase
VTTDQQRPLLGPPRQHQRGSLPAPPDAPPADAQLDQQAGPPPGAPADPRPDAQPAARRTAAPEPEHPRRRVLRGSVSTMGSAQVLADLAAVLVTGAVAALLATGALAWRGVLVEAVLAGATVLALLGLRLYRSHLTASVLDQVPGLLAAGLVGAVAAMVASELENPEASVGSLLFRAALLVVALVLLRSLALAVVRAARRRRVVSHRTLVLGGGDIGADLVRRFNDHPELGLEPVGVLDPDPLYTPLELDVPCFGGFDRLADTISAQGVGVVVVAFSGVREAELVEVLRTCDRLECDFFFVPRLFELQHVHGDMEQAWGMPLVRVRRAAFRTFGWKVKRAFDLVSASLLLVAVAPVMAAVALAVRLEGGPGIFFSQVRVGLDGRPFTMLKFRSLKPADDGESSTLWNVAHDHRMGPVGRLIRATSLDELPQLVNVIRGEMSVVGPRPERPFFVDQFSSRIPRYTGRHRVPAGLTGLAAVHGLRGDTSISDRTMLDNYYIENWSLWLDAKVLAQTVASLVRHPGS